VHADTTVSPSPRRLRSAGPRASVGKSRKQCYRRRRRAGTRRQRRGCAGRPSGRTRTPSAAAPAPPPPRAPAPRSSPVDQHRHTPARHARRRLLDQPLPHLSAAALPLPDHPRPGARTRDSESAQNLIFIQLHARKCSPVFFWL
jgi:hypothetical protein